MKTKQPITNEKKVLNHLKRFKKITPKTAWIKYGCYRLSAVIFNLRSKGHNITTIPTGKENYATYVLNHNMN